MHPLSDDLEARASVAVGWMGKASTDQAMPMILGRPALSYPLLSVAVCVTCVVCAGCVREAKVQDVDCVESAHGGRSVAIDRPRKSESSLLHPPRGGIVSP